MKKIVCDLCDSQEFVKEGGMFICQGCGTKYTLEEAKSMMREVEGATVPVFSGAVNSVPMGNPNQAQIDNMLILAANAYEASNLAETESYCNQAIVLDAMCYKAWNLKAKAVGWQSTINNIRIEEAAHSFCKSIEFAPEEEKEQLTKEAVDELKNLGLALISTRKKRFANSPNKEELSGFSKDRITLLNSLKTLVAKTNASYSLDDYEKAVAKEMNLAAVAAYEKVQKIWNDIEHPTERDFDNYLDFTGNIAQLLRDAIETSDNDDEEDITRYENLIIVLDAPMNAHSYKREWNSYYSRYDWVVEYSLSDDAQIARMNEQTDIYNKITEIVNKMTIKLNEEAQKAQEEKQARIKAYWDAHAEEKNALEADKKDLQAKADTLNSEISKIKAEIIEVEPKGNVPSEDEDKKLREQIKELEKQRDGLGMFAGKQKKQITEEIASLNGRRDSLKSKIEEEKKARQAEADKKIATLNEKKKDLQAQLDKATKRIKAIETELTKDPEE